MKQQSNDNSELAYNKLIACLIQLYKEAPLYYYVLSNLDKRIDTSCPTMGVQLDTSKKLPKINLIYNPDFLVTLNNAQLGMVLEHEALHIIFKHLLRGEGYNRMIANIAMDLTINENIFNHKDKAGSLYIQACHKEAYPVLKGLNLSELTWESIYKLLLQDKNIQDIVKNHNWILGDGQSQNEGKSQVMGEIAVEGALKQAIKSLKGSHAGNVSGNVQRRIQELTQVKFNWKHYISMFAQNIITEKRQNTWKKYNRRLPIIVAGHKKEYKANLLVAIDNSGSTSNAYQDFINHICTISKIMNIDVIGCDAKVNFEYTFKDGKPPKDFTDNMSGGGTLFQPVFDYAIAKKKYNGIVYFTDGYNFDNSSLNTFKIPTLFAICNGGQFVKGYKNIKIE